MSATLAARSPWQRESPLGDITIGRAKVCAGYNKNVAGWFLPGGGFTTSRAIAEDAALSINNEMHRLDPR